MLVGEKSTQQTEQLLLELLKGPVSLYFDTEQTFEKSAMEAQIEESLQAIRVQFKADGVTAKYLTSSFADLITLVNSTKGMTPKELNRSLKSFGISKNTAEVNQLV